jgi:hypothetical protein
VVLAEVEQAQLMLQRRVLKILAEEVVVLEEKILTMQVVLVDPVSRLFVIQIHLQLQQ